VANLSSRKTDYSAFQALNVQILGVGADHPFVQKTFADSLELPYPLLSDHPDLQVIRRYGVLSLSQIGPHPPETTARRAFFLVDPQGMVRGRWLAEPTEVLPSETILEAARKLAGQR